MNYVISSIVSYVAGIISGFLIHDVIGAKNGEKFKGSTFVLIVVTIMWSTSMIVDLLSPTYETSPMVHALMGAIVGFFYKPQPPLPPEEKKV